MATYKASPANQIIPIIKCLRKIGKVFTKTRSDANKHYQARAFLSSLITTFRTLLQLWPICVREFNREAIKKEVMRIGSRLHIFLAELQLLEKGLRRDRKRCLIWSSGPDPIWIIAVSQGIQKMQHDLASTFVIINVHFLGVIIESLQLLRTEVPEPVDRRVSSNMYELLTEFNSCLRIVRSKIQGQTREYDETLKLLDFGPRGRSCAQRQPRDLSRQSGAARIDTTSNQYDVNSFGSARIFLKLKLESDADLYMSNARGQNAHTLVATSLHTFALLVAHLSFKLRQTLKPYTQILLRKSTIASSPSPRTLVGHSFILEDALGRPRCLPLECFRHWDIFRPYLRHLLKAVPRENRVSSRLCFIIDAKTKRVVQRHEWTDKLMPGLRMQIAMLLTPRRYLFNAMDITLRPFLKSPRPGMCLDIGRALSIAVTNERYSEHGWSLKVTSHATTRFLKVNDGCVKYENGKPLNLSLVRPIYLPTNKKAEIRSVEEIFPNSHSRIGYMLFIPGLAIRNSEQYYLSALCSPLEVCNYMQWLLHKRVSKCQSKQDPDHIREAIAGRPLESHILRVNKALEACRAEALISGSVKIYNIQSEFETFLECALYTIRILQLWDSKSSASLDINMANRLYDWAQARGLLNEDLSKKPSRLLRIKTLTGANIYFRFLDCWSVLTLKCRINHLIGVPIGSQYLIYNGKKLHDEDNIHNRRLTLEYTVYLTLNIWSDQLFLDDMRRAIRMSLHQQ